MRWKGDTAFHFLKQESLKKYAPAVSHYSLAEFDLNFKNGDTGILLYQHSKGGHYVSVEKENDKIIMPNRKKGNTTIKTNLKKFFNSNGYRFSWGAIVK